ncbi:50S ribosomal protein L29 [Patescibacteria group bacterium]
MNKNEILEKSNKELNIILAQKREKTRDLRFRVFTAGLKNVREIRKIKKDIARILTRLNKPIA